MSQCMLGIVDGTEPQIIPSVYWTNKNASTQIIHYAFLVWFILMAKQDAFLVFLLQAYFVRASEQQVNKTLNQSNKHLLFFQHDLRDLRFIFDTVLYY